MNQNIKDKKLIAQRFGRYFKTYHSQATVQEHVALQLVKTLKTLNLLSKSHVLEIGCGTGYLTEALLQVADINKWSLNDICHDALQSMSYLMNQYQVHAFDLLEGDAETIALPMGLDMVVSTSTVQWFQNFELFVNKVSSALNQNGIFAFSTFGEKNYQEIKTLTGVGLDYLTLEKLKTTIGTTFDLICAESWIDTLTFESPMAVLKHIKQTGVNGIQQPFQGKQWLVDFTTAYQNLFTIGDKVRLTYHPILIIAKKR